MRPPTSNPITQAQHGPYNAVDYSARPNPIFYAPEDVTFVSYVPNSGDCGNNLKVRGASGQHGFCHLDETYITAGQSKRKGEPLGKMGFTGKTIPVGEQGRHLHWVVLRGTVYIYPPSLITEAFGGGNMDELTKLREIAKTREDYLNKIALAAGVDPNNNPIEADDVNQIIANIDKKNKRIQELEAQVTGTYVPVGQLFLKK